MYLLLDCFLYHVRTHEQLTRFVVQFLLEMEFVICAPRLCWQLARGECVSDSREVPIQ